MRGFIAIILGGLVALIAVGSFMMYDFSKSPIGDVTKDIVLIVNPGENYAAVVEDLGYQGVLKNYNQELLFNFYSRLVGARGKIKSGEYAINGSMTPKEIINILASGKSITRSFTVSEGLNIYEIALIFEKAGYGKKTDFLKACFNKSLLKKILNEEVYSCEGYLFPETYKIERNTSAEKLVSEMMETFVKTYLQIKDRNQLGWTRSQIVTLASIIEKETGAPEERSLISSVFHNRLKKKMRLQTDPTVLYGILDQTKSYKANITKTDLITPTKFNTYTNEGLPFGPISNPGKESLIAALEPKTSEYLYFVSKNDGTHIFNIEYESHLKSVSDFQLNAKAREGKSWRDLSSRK
jgi:UPF0755 protein